jgi:hypothetical protein
MHAYQFSFGLLMNTPLLNLNLSLECGQITYDSFAKEKEKEKENKT